MKQISKYTIALLTVIVAWLPTACSSDEGPATEEVTLYDIVCLRSQEKTGTTFTMTKPAGTRLITYHSSQLLDTTRVHVGDRCLLAYRTGSGAEAYKSGQITALGYSVITNDKLRKGASEDIAVWDTDAVYMMSVWQSEDFLNMRLKLPYTTAERNLMVVVDESTLGNEYPDCYLIHKLLEPVNTFDREYYLSVDMGALRKKTDCKGFNLVLKNLNLKKDNYHFELLDY